MVNSNDSVEDTVDSGLVTGDSKVDTGAVGEHCRHCGGHCKQ